MRGCRSLVAKWQKYLLVKSWVFVVPQNGHMRAHSDNSNQKLLMQNKCITFSYTKMCIMYKDRTRHSLKCLIVKLKVNLQIQWNVVSIITNDKIFPLNKLLLIVNIRTRYSSLCRQMLRGIPKRLINFTFSLHYVGCFHHNAPKNHLKGGKKQFAHMAIRWQHIHTAGSLSGVSQHFFIPLFFSFVEV